MRHRGRELWGKNSLPWLKARDSERKIFVPLLFPPLQLLNEMCEDTHHKEAWRHLDSWGRGQGHHRLAEPVSCYQWAVGLSWLIGFHCWFFLITFLSSSFSELPSPFPLFFSSYPLHIFNAFGAGMVWVKNAGHTRYKDTGKVTGPSLPWLSLIWNKMGFK